MFLFPLTAWQPDAKALAFAQDVTAAIDAVMPRKCAADLMGIREPLLSEWLSCLRPLNAFRLTALPSEFWTELLSRTAKRNGGLYLGPDVVTLLKGASSLRKMAKMAPAVARERKSA
jgi:hypothetical protein